MPVVMPPVGQPGVVVVPPTAVHLDIHRQVAQVLKDLPPGKTRALVSVETTVGFNLAVAHKFDEHWLVEAWVGKAGWGKQPVAGGVQVMFSS